MSSIITHIREISTGEIRKVKDVILGENLRLERNPGSNEYYEGRDPWRSIFDGVNFEIFKVYSEEQDKSYSLGDYVHHYKDPKDCGKIFKFELSNYSGDILALFGIEENRVRYGHNRDDHYSNPLYVLININNILLDEPKNNIKELTEEELMNTSCLSLNDLKEHYGSLDDLGEEIFTLVKNKLTKNYEKKSSEESRVGEIL